MPHSQNGILRDPPSTQGEKMVGLFMTMHDAGASGEANGKGIELRRAATLRKLAAQARVGDRFDEVCASVVEALADDPASVRFALLYLTEPGTGGARLAAAAGAEAADAASPQTITLPCSAGDTVWPLGEALDSGRPVVVGTHGEYNGLAGAPAVVTALSFSCEDERTGALVIGVNPALPLDAGYRSFLDMSATLIESAVAGARAHEAERERWARELQAAQRQIERANSAKSRFLAAASHDLRQPLAALKLYVGIMKGSGLAGANARVVQNMEECVTSLGAMLGDLLDVSKLEAGVVTPETCDFPLMEMLGTVLATHAPEAEEKGLSMRLVPQDWGVRTDPGLLRRVLGHLVSNAIRYTERGGVMIACRRRFGRRWVEVWDTGIGFPEDKSAEIFEEFRQLGNDARNRSKGAGLGLAIVARTAQLLGLRVRVKSRVGRGSMFAIELPAGNAPSFDLRHVGLARPLCIALVEDDPLVAEALAMALTDMGHEVLSAASGRQILARLDGVAPDVLVSDYRLGDGETGADVVSALRSAFGPELPAVIVTGETDPQLLRKMAGDGVAIEHKPISLEALNARIAAVVDGT